MGVPKVRAGVRVELISERVAFVYGTLGNVRHAVVVLRAALVESVPMDHQLQTVHVIQHVDDHLVSFANLRRMRMGKKTAERLDSDECANPRREHAMIMMCVPVYSDRATYG